MLERKYKNKRNKTMLKMLKLNNERMKLAAFIKFICIA